MAESKDNCSHENAFEYDMSSQSGTGVYDLWAKACPDCGTFLGTREKSDVPVTIKAVLV